MVSAMLRMDQNRFLHVTSAPCLLQTIHQTFDTLAMRRIGMGIISSSRRQEIIRNTPFTTDIDRLRLDSGLSLLLSSLPDKGCDNRFPRDVEQREVEKDRY
uniref:Uncharacterized protein n=1 Tax=Candidatus Kentrum sp. MB TaxID=2138164 RepID=A0A450XPP4_9GAMM|nr:MAG: hypothetical protein BECKMB1821G_GA0114241_108113 [Candidatus Kentron sp. MB]